METITKEVVNPRWNDVLEAARRNDTHAVELIIQENEALVRTTDEEERTLAHIAVDNNNLSLLKYIFETHGSIVLYYVDDFGNTVLQQAIEKNRFPMVKYLVDVCGWNVSKPNPMSYGDTPIHVAAAEGQLEILRYFVEEKKGDPNIQNGLGDPPAFPAAEKSRLHIIRYLHEECEANMHALNNHDCNILHSCAKSDDLTVPKYLLDEKKLALDVNWRDITNCTAVYTATTLAKYEFVQYMVRQHHADINVGDTMRRTPLHAAAHDNNYSMCRFLVNNGANLEARDAYNITPMEEATQPQLIGFLDQCWKERVTRRVRRSVPLVPRSVEQPSRRGRGLRISEGVASGLRICADCRPDTSYSVLDNLLFVVDSVVRYVRGATRERISFPALLSPLEIVRGRMDPLAIDAVNASYSVFQR